MTPKTIILMRHAEKPADKQDRNLSPEGLTRAQQLVNFIPSTFGVPDRIFAAAVSANSERCVQTVTPLAQSMPLPVKAKIKDANFALLAGKLFSSEEYAGKAVVICWHHDHLPALAAALGAKGAEFTQAWEPSVFNVIFFFEFTTASDPKVSRVVEPF